MHILITRLEPFASSMASDILNRNSNWQVTVSPLFHVTYIPLINVPDCDGWIATSRQVLYVPGVDALRNKPVFCIGGAQFFEDQGFTVKGVYQNVKELTDHLPRKNNYLYVRGQHITQEINCAYQHVGYAAEPVSTWPEDVIKKWFELDVVVLMSCRAAETFRHITTLPMNHLTCLCHSEKIANVVRDLPWKNLKTSVAELIRNPAG